ncbi:MAG: hypothetical protein M1355_03920 [Patescibacteria group bacterium]|nr:hypothetical protein [Patescibacteria group bacterium]
MKEKEYRKPEILDINEIYSFEKALKKNGMFLSLYLPSDMNKEAKHLWDSIYSREKKKIQESQISEKEKNEALRLLKEINNYLKNREIDYYNTLVLFLNNQVFKYMIIPEILEASLFFSNRPFLSPLKKIKESDRLSLIICLDRIQAELFSVRYNRFHHYYGRLETTVPQKIRGGSESWKGLRETKNFLHTETHLNVHLKKVSRKLSHLLKHRDFEEIYIGGHEEIFKKFEEKLPESVRQKIAGRFIGEPDILLAVIRKEGFSKIKKGLI